MTADGARRPGAARHGPGVSRLPVLAAVVLSLVAAGLVVSASPVHPAVPAATLVAAAAPLGAESSDWFCTGGSGTALGPADATLDLVNAGTQRVRGTLTVTTSTGTSATRAISVAPGAQATAAPATLVQGPWLASRVDLDGGGVTVSEVVHGSDGWAEAPCATTASPTWYFASGATTGGNLLFLSVYNPGATVAVADLSFVTPSGVTRPMPFQGLVLAPGAVVVAGVASYVQDQPSVAAVVGARVGRVVATELEEHSVGGVSGLSLRLGSPSPEHEWLVPRTVDVTGGRTETVVFNPTRASEHVTVAIRLPSGPVAPYGAEVGPDSAWTLVTSSLIRVPANTDYATTVTASGSGAVVDRIVRSSAAGTSPQWGAVTATPASWSRAPSGRWALPSPATRATRPVAGAAPFALDLFNPGPREVSVSVAALAGPGRRSVGRSVRRIPAGAFTVVEPTVLAVAGRHAIVVTSTGPLAASLDATPAGMPGVVALAGVPQAG